MRLNRLLRIVVVFGLLACAARASHAQTTRTWLGTSGTALWDIGSNWSGGTAPSSSGTTSLVFSGTTLLTSTNTIANLPVSGISFTNTTVGSGGFLLTGSAVALRGNISTTALGTSSVTDEIALGLVLTGGNITINMATPANHNLIISGAIGQDSSARTLSKTGNSTLTLTNTSNSFGALTLSSGETRVSQLGTAGVPSQTGTTAVIVSQATLVYTGGGDTSDKQFQVGTVAGNTNGATIINNGTGPLNLVGTGGVFTSTWASTSASRTLALQGTNTGDNTISARIADVNSGTTALALAKSTAGKWILSGSNTYTGATSVSAGTLQIGAGGTTGSLNTASAISVSSGATLAFARSNTITQGSDFNSVIGGNGNVTQLGAGALVLDGVNTYSGTTRVVAGTLQIGSGGTTGSLNTASVITGSAGATLAFNRSDTLTQGTHFNTVIGGSLGVSQLGSGRLVLNGNNTYSGATQISSGILEIAPGGTIGSTSGITLAGSTAELKYNGAAALTRPITLTQGIISGTGTIGSAVTFATGDILAPGNSPGTQAYTSLHAWSPGGTYQWELNSLSGSAGSNWDLVNVTSGTLSLSTLGSAPGSQFILDLVTLDALNAAGPLATPFDGGSYTFAIASYNPSNFLLPIGFSNTAGTDLTGLFQINLGNWQGLQPQAGNISVKINSAATGIDLVIVPEPETLALAGIGIAAAWALRRRLKAGTS
jgi:fibronectin-binding autotransporter adhesin